MQYTFSERRRNCTLTPLANNQLQNQENQCCKVRPRFPPGLDHHSSEEELECIHREFAAEKRKWSQVSRLACCGDNYNTSSSDEEVKHLCGASFRPVVDAAENLHASPSPVLFSASPPKRLQPLGRSPASRPLIFTSVSASFEPTMPCKRHRQGYGDKVARPSLDLEKMQQVRLCSVPDAFVLDGSLGSRRVGKIMAPLFPTGLELALAGMGLVS